MKSHLVSLALFAFTALAPVAAHAQSVTHSPTVKTLYTLHANAKEAGYNAGIYQWQRVNREVDRVIAAEKSVGRALMSDPTLVSKRAALHEAVNALRAARLVRDSERVREAATRVAEAAANLLP